MREVLGLVLDDLPAELVAPQCLTWLVAAAAAAPSFAAVGFECRLAVEAGQIDLQLGTRRRERESIVRSLARIREHEGLSPAWERVLGVCREWTTTGTLLHDGLDELWCELDLDPGSGPPTLDDLVPSVFASFQRTGTVKPRVVAERILEHLGEDEGRQGPPTALANSEEACPPGAWVSHVGVMLGRQASGLRIHVSAVPLASIGGFLRRAGWPGDIDGAVAAARLLLDHGDGVVLCLDAIDGLLPRIGLECFFAQKHGLDPRWRPLLDRLVDAGLASAEKAAALLRWPGTLTPADVPWPEPLLTRSLTQPADVLGVVDRRLSHVKLSLGPGEPTTAKAYFGAGHVWQRLGAAGDAPRPVPARRPAPSVRDAVDRALAFLLAARNQGGWWRDFFDRARPAGVDRRVAGYASDEWVTAYIAAALATLGREAARVAALEALALLLARERTGAGWGYHALLPADADTTTWVLRLADALDAPLGPRLAAARSFVSGLVGPGGGVATYPPEAAQQLAAFLAMPGPYDGWCAEHMCVTAAAGTLGLGPGPLALLACAQAADGSWAGHWWDDDEYATLRAIESLSIDPGNDLAVLRGAGWAAARIGRDGSVLSAAHHGPSPFATALCLHAVIVGGGERGPGQAVDRAARWLLSAQREDGSWAPSARLRVPAPSERNPLATPETTLTYLDDDALFTTATVLAALGRVDSQ